MRGPLGLRRWSIALALAGVLAVGVAATPTPAAAATGTATVTVSAICDYVSKVTAFLETLPASWWRDFLVAQLQRFMTAHCPSS